MANIIRIILTIALLVVVWQNAHWSVALSLTLVSIGMESCSAILSKITKDL